MSAASDPIPVAGPTASKKAVREKKKRAHLSQRQQKDDVRAVLETVAGRRVLRRVLEFAGVYRGGFTGERAHFNEGQRNVGLFLIAEIESATPNALELLRAQHHKDTQTDGN